MPWALSGAEYMPRADGALLEALRFIESGQAEAAVGQLELALALAPERVDLVASICRHAADLGAFELAVTAAQRAVDLDGDDPDSRFLLARTMVRGVLARGAKERATEELGVAEGHVRAGLELAPDRARGWSVLAVILERLGREAEALDAWGRAQSLAPTDPEMAAGLAVAYAHQARWEEAVPLFAAVADARPDSSDAYVNLGIALHGLRRWEEAIATFTRAIELAPPSARLEIRLGNAHLALGQRDVALDHFRKALAHEPDSLESLLVLGRTLHEAEQLQAARGVVQRAIRLYPEHPEVEALAQTLDLVPVGAAPHDAFTPRGPAALEADTARFPVPDLLDFLANHRVDGLLEVEGEANKNAFALRDGLLVAARVPGVAPLWSWLVEGRADALDAEIRALPCLNLAAALRARGGLEPTAMEEAVGRQGVAALLAMMAWPPVRARYYPEAGGQRRGEDDGAIELRLVLLEALRQWDESRGTPVQDSLP